jgi:hypothetical protein
MTMAATRPTPTSRAFKRGTIRCEGCGGRPEECESARHYPLISLDRACELARCAAARGATLLDTRWPDWASHVDLKSLSLASPAQCVLGQLAPVYIPKDGWPWYFDDPGDEESAKVIEPSYHDLVAMLEPFPSLGSDDDEAWTSLNGFTAGRILTYELLTCAWMEKVAERQCSH